MQVNQQHRSNRNGGIKGVAFGLLLAVTATIAAITLARRFQSSNTDQAAVFTVAQGPLDITVTESGTITPSEQLVLKSELEGRSTILFLIPEGTEVEQGDLLVELDASNLQDRRIEQAINVENAEAAFIRSRENLEVAKNQAQSDVEKAELTLQFAREDLEKYKSGEYPNKLKELEARITLAREEQKRAEEKLKWSQVLFSEKYLSESEIQADELSVKKAALDVDLAENNLKLLQDYEYKRQITELESDLRQAEMALDRTTRKARADVIQAEAELRAKESEFTQKKNQLEKLIQQIGKAKILAPRDGLVVYATSTEFRWRGSDEPLAEGQEVHERQELIHLPTASSFLAKVKIHESSLKKVRLGLPVSLRIDALPGMRFDGTVSTIAPLPDARSAFMNPDLKLYDTDITIDGGGDLLRTGMNCEATILIASYPDAVYVPVQCVVRLNGNPTVYLKTPEGHMARSVTIGEDNRRMVHVTDGLTPGEQVLLAPPLNAPIAHPSARREQESIGKTASSRSQTPSADHADRNRKRKPEGGDRERGARQRPDKQQEKR